MKWVLSILALVYLLNPLDLLPDFILGAGWLDDLAVLGLLGYYLYRSGYRGFPFSGESSRAQDNNRPQPDIDDGVPPDDPHRTLGVGPEADQNEIRQAYRHLAAQYHPDKVAHLGVDLRHLAEQKFKAIQAAYELLKRP